MIDKQTFKKLSRLSKIDFTLPEEESLIIQLNDIVAFISQVTEFDGEYDDTLENNITAYADLREDVKIPTATPEQLLANTVSENDCYIIPKVVD